MIELALHAWFYSLVFALNCTLRIGFYLDENTEQFIDKVVL